KTKSAKSTSTSEITSKEFFKAVRKSSIAVTVIKQDSLIIIKNGEEHNLYLQTGGGGGFSMMGGGMGAPPMFISRPGSKIKNGQAETYFNTVLNSSNLQFIPDAETETRYDKIQRI